MSIIRKGQYLVFEKCIAKVTGVHRDIADGFVSLRKFSLGNTKRGYSFQQTANIKYIEKKIREGKIQIAPREEILRILFFVIKIGGYKIGISTPTQFIR